jgi:hypothetical protein
MPTCRHIMLDELTSYSGQTKNSQSMYEYEMHYQMKKLEFGWELSEIHPFNYFLLLLISNITYK